MRHSQTMVELSARMYDVKENVRCEGEGGVIPLKEKRYFFRRQQGSAPQPSESV